MAGAGPCLRDGIFDALSIFSPHLGRTADCPPPFFAPLVCTGAQKNTPAGHIQCPAGANILFVSETEDILRHRLVKQPLHLRKFTGLPHDPHELGHGGLGGHVVGLQQPEGALQVWAARDYLTAMRRYNGVKTMQIIGEIRYADAKSKGINNASMNDGDILRELVFKILH